MAAASLPVTVTDKVKVKTKSGVAAGEVKFVGSIRGKPGVFFGVELKSGAGRNSGSVEDVQYFPCQPDKGVFVPRAKITQVTPKDGSMPRLSCGDQIDLPGKGRGVISYVGYPQFRDGIWYGVVLDEEKGRNDGTVQDQFYFNAEPGHGTFLPLAKMKEIGGRARRGSRKGRQEAATEAMAASRALKQWMQSNKVWNKDLFAELVTLGVTESEGLASIAPGQIREVLRSVKVANRKELSDRSAQARNEKLLNKFHKLYKGIAGVDERVGVDESKEAERSATTGGNPLPEGGEELKKWMKINNIWQKDLFVELMKIGINDPVMLDGQHDVLTSNDEYNELARAVTVARAHELSDASAKDRNEQLLAKFEKLWRDLSQISKRMNVTATSLNEFEVEKATEENADMEDHDDEKHEEEKEIEADAEPTHDDDFVEMERDLFDDDDDGDVKHTFSRVDVLAGVEDGTTATHKSRSRAGSTNDDFWELDRDLFASDDEDGQMMNTFSRRNVFSDVSKENVVDAQT